MLRITLRLLATALVMSSGLAAAASKSAKADRVVETVLQQEARGAVTRRADDLGSTIEESDRARWAAGYVQMANDWQRFDVPVPVDERIREYEQRRGEEPLSRQQHLALASWCREQKLHEQARAHLWAVLVSETRAVNLWQQLGYEFVNGIWMTKDERRRVENEQRAQDLNYRKWASRAQTLATRLSDENPGQQALARTELNSIDDLNALPALEAKLSEASVDAAMSLVVWLSHRPQTGTTLALVRQSIGSRWLDVRTMATDALRNRRFDQAMPPLLYALSTSTNLTVNQSSRPGRDGNLLMTAELQRETWNTIERRAYAVRLGPQLDISVGMRSGRIRTSWHSWVPSWREQNDLDRLQTDINKDLRQISQKNNDEINERNHRVSLVLSQITGTATNRTPEEWWSTWSTLTETEAPTTKNVVEVSETAIVRPSTPTFSYYSSCLPAGTMVATAFGPEPVESIHIGDTVLAKDIETGELSYKPVIHTTVRRPQPLVTLHTNADSIRATLGHYFWVSGKGWRMAKEIKAGDRLHGVQGTVTVTDVSPCGREAVYNLVVEEANSYFVGESRILSHDVTPPVPTDIIVPGLAAR